MDTISGFFSQNMVPGLLALVLIPFVLIIIYIIFLYAKATRRVKTMQQGVPLVAANGLGLAELQAARASEPASLDDMPDLSVLSVTPPARGKAPDPSLVTLQNGLTTRAKSLLTVMRDESDGQLLVVIDGKGYRSLAAAADAKRDFTRVMKELSSVIMQPEATSEQAHEPFRPPAPLASAADLLADAQPVSVPTEAPSVRPAVAPRAAGVLPGDLPSYKFDDNPAVIRGGVGGFKKVDFVAPPTIDIPSAIEAYLQWRLSTTGLFAGRQLHVLSAPGGGVRIRVDENYYDFVDDIEDGAAKAFIKDTIAEWQDRQG